MNIGKRIFVVWAVLIVALFAINAFAQLALNRPPDKAVIMSNLCAMPQAFTENRGQWGDKTLFKADAGGATFYFCKDEVAYLFTRDTDELLEDEVLPGRDSLGMEDRFSKPRYKKEAMLIKAQFIGSNQNAQIIGENQLSYNCNYLYGNDPSKWRTDVPNYSAITYKDIWPGIDLRYHGNGTGMKYDFIVNPAADISQIRIRYEGIDNLSISNTGDLEAQTRFGPVYENIPVIYQEKSGDKVSVSGRYRLIEPGVFGFFMEGNYNPAYSLVIDPELVYSTYLGGSSADYGVGIAVDGSGDIYVTGITESFNFPLLDPYDNSFNGNFDVFVAKLSSAGDNLIYSTYLGGNGMDQPTDIAVDGFGNAYLTGSTSSPNFPIVNAYDNSLDGPDDAFVLKLSSDGNSLIYSTYLGGSSVDYGDYGEGIAIDGFGNAYVTGNTWSTNFPTVNPYDAVCNGGDAFVTKLSSDGSTLIYSTFLGGTGGESANDICVDAQGCAYIMGGTSSTDFPTVNAFDGNLSEGPDIFVSKFNSTGNSLVFSTYLGGNGSDDACGLALDSAGACYVTGWTTSTDFPLANEYDGSLNGNMDAFVVKLSPQGNSMIFGTYLGGSSGESGYAISINRATQVYVTGFTNSPDFPTDMPYDGSYNGGNDVFFIIFSSSGDSMLYGTYLGGNDNDEASDMTIDAEGFALIIGSTRSPFPVVNPYDGGFNGVSDAFIAKFGPPPCSYVSGDINGDDLRGGGDVTYGVRFFKLIGNRPPDSCYMDSTGAYLYVAGDVNGNCEFRASDITRLVAYFKLIAPLQYCHFFPPPPLR